MLELNQNENLIPNLSSSKRGREPLGPGCASGGGATGIITPLWPMLFTMYFSTCVHGVLVAGPMLGVRLPIMGKEMDMAPVLLQAGWTPAGDTGAAHTKSTPAFSGAALSLPLERQATWEWRDWF